MSGEAFKAGDIIAAHPDLDFSPDFRQSVIVLLSAGQGATIGVDIASNQITGNLFKGGPVKMPVPIALHKVEDSIPSSRRIGDSGYAFTEMGDNATVVALLSKNPKHMAILAGYAGWAPGQLEKEANQQNLWQKVEHISLGALLKAWPKQRWMFATAGIDYSNLPNTPKPTLTPTPPSTAKAKPLTP